jgi:hypothetical protein
VKQVSQYALSAPGFGTINIGCMSCPGLPSCSMSYNSRVQPHPLQRRLLSFWLIMVYKILKKKPYFINNDYVPSKEEDWPYYECLWCGIIDEMDEDSGIVIPINIGEIFLCSKCRLIFAP